MKCAPLFLAAIALSGIAACDQTDQARVEQGSVQLPGEHSVSNRALTVPPDEWAAPPRSTQTAYLPGSPR